MSRPAEAEAWSEARLEAAFERRAAEAARPPADLGDRVLGAIPNGARPARRWLPLVAAATVVLVALMVGSAVLGPTRPGPTVPPVGASGIPFGDPLSVSAAIAVRDGIAGGAEILVGGFLSPSPAFMRCAAQFGPPNPTRLGCPEAFQWLMEQPEELLHSTGEGIDLRGPTGPGFHPSFALVKPPDIPADATRGNAPVAVQLLGHFHDRRAALCSDDDRTECGHTFVVDRVLVVGSTALPVQTDRRTEAPTIDRQEDVDAIVAAVAPRTVIVSRLLLTVGESIGVEPILADDLFVPFVDQMKLAWIVTAVDPGNGVPTSRTFMLLDGSNWFAEMTASGAVLLDRTVAEPTGNPTPALSPASPSAFDGAPHTILGMPVLNVAQVVSQRKREQASDRDEYAIAGWYIGPQPGVTCDPPLPPVHPPTPPCDEARHWLLFDPQQWGVRPGQVRADPEEYPDVLNPIIPVDVPFETLAGWDGDTPSPMAVIVLGHFDDVRVEAFHGNAYFVVDALAWSAGSPLGPEDRTVRLTDGATEDPASVSARIAGPSGRQALVSWLTTVDGRDLVTIDPFAPQFPELIADGPVWIVRRLVLDTADGRPRVAVETGYTRDNGTRVWLTPTPDSHADLVTTIDLGNLDAHTAVLHVFDYPDIVSSVGLAPSKKLSWQALGPIPDFIEVARGASNREVVVRWRGAGCDTEWGLEVKGFGDGPIVLQPRRYNPECDSPEILREVLLVFDEPVALDRFRTDEPCCG